METRGRKKITLLQEELDKLIHRFTQDEKVSGWTKYSEVYRYAKRLYENGEIPYQLSEDYWRRDGRQGKVAIDKANSAYEALLCSNKTSRTDIYVDTEECVNKFFTGKPSDKKRLIEALMLNEKKAKDCNEFLRKNDALKDTIEALTGEKKALEALVKQYQTILFSWFNASIKSDVPLINLLTTGKSRHPIVDFFFDTAFSNPKDGYAEFDEYRQKLKEKDSVEKDNIVIPIMKSSRIQAVRDKHKDD